MIFTPGAIYIIVITKTLNPKSDEMIQYIESILKSLPEAIKFHFMATKVLTCVHFKSLSLNVNKLHNGEVSREWIWAMFHQSLSQPHRQHECNAHLSSYHVQFIDSIFHVRFSVSFKIVQKHYCNVCIFLLECY